MPSAKMLDPLVIGVENLAGCDLLEDGSIRRLVLLSHRLFDVVHPRLENGHVEDSGEVFCYPML